MLHFRPLVRTLPQKSVSLFTNNQTNPLPSRNTGLQYTVLPTNDSILQDATVANIMKSFSFSKNTFIEDLYQPTINQPSPFTCSSGIVSPLDSLTDSQFIEFKASLIKRALDKVQSGMMPDLTFLADKHNNILRAQECIEALVEVFHINNLIEHAEYTVKLAHNIFGIPSGANVKWILMCMNIKISNWERFDFWFREAVEAKQILSQFNWSAVILSCIESDKLLIRPLDLFVVLVESKIGFNLQVTEYVLDYCQRFKKPNLIQYIFKSIANSRDPVLYGLVPELFHATKEVGTWSNIVQLLHFYYKSDVQLCHLHHFNALEWTGKNSNNFQEILMLIKFLQTVEVDEANQHQFILIWLNYHNKIRNNLYMYRPQINLGYFHLLLKKLIRMKTNPDTILDILLDMKQLGITGHEEIRTVLDIFVLNIGLNPKISFAEKNRVKSAIGQLVPHITSSTPGDSGNFKSQEINHRILQSDNPNQCASELRLMLEQNLRPSSVAITHTLARFLHSKKYSEGLAIFRLMQPSLSDIASEMGWMSACGPVYNFAIRMCCRRLLASEAHELIRELETKHGFLDAFASAELIIMTQKCSGHNEAIRIGNERLSALRDRHLKIPPYFFNVLLNTLAEANQLQAMWKLYESLDLAQFLPTAVTYGTLVKAALKEHNYSRARLLCEKAVNSKVYCDGPAMPIFSQIIEYNLEHRKVASEVSDLLDQVQLLQIPTNPRFDLLKLRAMSDLIQKSPDDVVSFLFKLESVQRVPASHYSSVVKYLTKSAAPLAVEVIAHMRINHLVPDFVLYDNLFSILAQNTSKTVISRLKGMYQLDYPQLQ